MTTQGVLKLNFDGIFLEDERKGGYGGGHKEYSSSQVICGLPGLVACVDASGAEVFAMLMGCRELRKIVARDTVVESDFFLAIQWTYPSRLADLAE